MIASSDRGVPALTRFGDEARASRCPPVRQPRRCCLGTTRGIVWGAKAEPPVSLIVPGGFAVNALMHVAARD
jgi:hypothetical protein